MQDILRQICSTQQTFKKENFLKMVSGSVHYSNSQSTWCELQLCYALHPGLLLLCWQALKCMGKSLGEQWGAEGWLNGWHFTACFKEQHLQILFWWIEITKSLSILCELNHITNLRIQHNMLRSLVWFQSCISPHLKQQTPLVAFVSTENNIFYISTYRRYGNTKNIKMRTVALFKFSFLLGFSVVLMVSRWLCATKLHDITFVKQ